jgi:nucleotide-binding universal stress UspA family protein
MKNIALLTDMSPKANVALEYALQLCRVNKSLLNVIHIAEEEDRRIEAQILQHLDAITQKAEAEGIKSGLVFRYGDFMNSISSVLNEYGIDLVVVAADRATGFGQKLFGSNIMKLMERIRVNALVVQENSTGLPDSLRRMLITPSSHDNFSEYIQKSIDFARLTNSQIEMLVIGNAESLPEKLKNNIKRAQEIASAAGMSIHMHSIDHNPRATGYSRQILAFAAEKNIQLVSMLLESSPEAANFGKDEESETKVESEGIDFLIEMNREGAYFGRAEKQAMLKNQNGILILSINA